ncbi:MAG TPA: head GIN domain-containing protein [Candidatus Krumholzibacteria bacterium]|nr:head GIN domain-containing protein [Candidatus Krumholzibacteria bacterium]
MRFRHLVIAAAAVLLAASPALAKKAIDGSGKLETRNLDLPAFTKVDLGGAFDIDVTFGETAKVEVTIDDNLWDNLEADVDGGELRLDWIRNCKPSDDCRIRITMTQLEEFSLHGAGNVSIAGFDGPALAFKLRGAGDATISGRTGALDVLLTGAGSLHARDLEAKRVDVRLSGVGNCEVHAVDSLDADISGVGNVDYWGEPEHKVTHVSGMGSIRGR